MNLNGPQPHKKQIQILQRGIKHVTSYKPDRPIDLFQFYHPQVRKQFVDCYNLCRIWLQSLLYWKSVYPQQAFQIKTAYFRKIFVVKSPTLREYLDKFFESICQSFQFVQFIQIRLYEYGKDSEMIHVQSQRFYFSYTNKYANIDDVFMIKKKGINVIQKQIEFKRFLGKMEQELNKGYFCPLDRKCTYQLLMGYKWEHNKYKRNRHRLNLLQKWTQTQQKQQQDIELLNQAGTEQIEVYCERITPKIFSKKPQFQIQKQ